jgi:ATP-binding protein involved in chromosome partitioning
MSGYICECGEEPDFLGIGGGEKLAEELGIPFLGRIPLNAEVSQASDEGIPFVYKFPENPASKKVMEIADRVEEIVG